MTDEDNSSPTKYDGYSAYLSTLSSDTNSAFPQTSNTDCLSSKNNVSQSTGPLSNPVGSFAEDAVRQLRKSASTESAGDEVGDNLRRGGGSGVGGGRDGCFGHEADETTSPDQDEDNDNIGSNEMSPSPPDEDAEEQSTSDEEASNPPQWEDFMAHYWKLPTPEVPTSPSHQSDKPIFQIHAHAQDILLAEDTDLRPCPIKLELDEEPHLSPIRTGCIDIDIDGITSKSASIDDETDPSTQDELSTQSSPIKELSNAGLESSRIMAKLHVGEIPQDAVSIATPIKRRPQHPSKQSHVEKPLPTIQPYDLQSPNSFDEKRSVTSNTNTNNSDIQPTNAPEAQAWPHKISPLPSKSLIHSLGPILSRTSLRSLVMKKWSPSYWVHYGPHTLLLFRSKEALDDWRYNPYHGKKAREYLIKSRIDFYGEMNVMSEKDGKGGGSGGVLGHRILPVKRKSYGKNETEMYQFKLERWTNLGVSVLAAFASEEEAEVQILHDTIAKILKSCPYGGLRNIDHMLK